MANKEAKAKQENNKNKKTFIKDFKSELKKVNWPTPKQLLNNTIAVVTIVIITAAIVFLLDLTFETLNKYGVDKIKEVIKTENVTSNEEANNTTENNAKGENNTTEGNSETANETNNNPLENNVE